MTGPDETLCPSHIAESIEAYVMDGREPGGFVRACLENNLENAVTRADEVNLWTIPHIVAYLRGRVPSIAWGSRQQVERWLERKARERKRQALIPDELPAAASYAAGSIPLRRALAVKGSVIGKVVLGVDGTDVRSKP